ncbi:MAG: ribonuclease Y [Armatimonadetes bacterium]|nr:ribonuclease Y [Armatimonadota bacterium]
MAETYTVVLGLVVVAAIAVAMVQTYKARSRVLELTLGERISEAERLKEEARRDAEALRKEAILEAKDEAYKLKAEIDADNRERRAELQRSERRLAQKEEALDRRVESAERKERSLQQREIEIEGAHGEAQTLVGRQRAELARVAGLARDDARKELLREIEQEYKHEAAKLIRDIEEDARRDGDRRARIIVTQAIQRCAVDQTSETTVSVVPLPSDEMKGRIIGREGRNIRTFETLTGVDLVIDDTPEAVVLSGFDAVRREVARLALTTLVTDGRIHPGRIEETVKRAQLEVERHIQEAGERAVLETGVTGIAPEILRLLGKMKYRTSYGQNVLDHSIEVSHLAAILASEVGANVAISRRAGLFHDLGKALDHQVEGPHAVIGADVLRQHRERQEVIHAVEAHHSETEPETVEAILVMCADAISASRPGGRREALESYVKRVKRLEEIAQSFQGVEKGFAVQAGREVRLIVRPEQVDDLATAKLASSIARRIEEEMEYPGQIKVTVIREVRSTEYAR